MSIVSMLPVLLLSGYYYTAIAGEIPLGVELGVDGMVIITMQVAI